MLDLVLIICSGLQSVVICWHNKMSQPRKRGFFV
nr:MAG TPA: protein of unknown function (DUF5360) [Bacteriophage sp.]